MTRLYARLSRNKDILPYCLLSLIHLSIAKLQIKFFGYNSWRFKHCYFQCETLNISTPQQAQLAKKIARALRISARYLPWRSLCLDQAISAQRILTMWGLSNTVYLGMTKDQQGKWMAHAWVRSGSEWVIGYDPQNIYTTVGTYARMIDVS